MSHLVLSPQQFNGVAPVSPEEKSLTDPLLDPDIPEKEDENIGPREQRPIPQ